MWWLAIASALLCASCAPRGSAPAPVLVAERLMVDLDGRPRPGVLYEILHRETRQLDGEEERRVETRTLLRVGGERLDGLRHGRARVIRRSAEGESIDTVFTFELSPAGAMVGEPETACRESSLSAGPYLRHLVGARRIAREDVGEGSRWRADFLSDLVERPVPTTFRIDELDGRDARGRLVSSITLDGGDAELVAGTGRVRGRFVIALDDGFVGRTDLRSEVRGRVPGASAPTSETTLRTRSQMIVRHPEGGDVLGIECAGELDPGRVTARIREHLDEIQRCYETQLARIQTLAGRVMVRFKIGTDGHASEVEATENTTGSPEVAACVVDVIDRFHFDPPPGQRVTFAYPFVFAPQN